MAAEGLTTRARDAVTVAAFKGAWWGVRALPERAGVVAVPTVVFYAPEHAHLGRHLVRFAFCKSDDVLGDAVGRLGRLS